MPILIFQYPPSHQIMGPHLSNQAKTRIAASVTLGTIINQIISQCWAISNFTSSIIWVARTSPSKEPSTCLNHMTLVIFVILISNSLVANRLIRHQVHPESISVSYLLWLPDHGAMRVTGMMKGKMDSLTIGSPSPSVTAPPSAGDARISTAWCTALDFLGVFLADFLDCPVLGDLAFAFRVGAAGWPGWPHQKHWIGSQASVFALADAKGGPIRRMIGCH